MLFIAITHLLCTHDYVVDSLIAAATIQGWRLFHLTCTLVRLLFKAGVYLRVVSFQGNMVIQKLYGIYERSAHQMTALLSEIIIFLVGTACD